MKYEMETADEVSAHFHELDQLMTRYQAHSIWDDYHLFIRVIKNNDPIQISHCRMIETGSCIYIYRKMSGYEIKKRKTFLRKYKNQKELLFVNNYFTPIERWFYLSFPDSVLDQEYSLLYQATTTDTDTYVKPIPKKHRII